MEITKDKITEIFCIIDDFCKEYDAEIEKMAISEPNGGKHRRRKWAMSRSEIMAILIYFHFNTFRNFKHYYLFYVKNHLCDLFPNQLSYNRFIELESRVAVEMMLFIQLFCFGRCSDAAYYTNYGTWVDISAPGGDTYADSNYGGVYSTSVNEDGTSGYEYMQGTRSGRPEPPTTTPTDGS